MLTVHVILAPPSANVTLDDYLGFGAVANQVKLRDIMSTIDGPFCYMYDD
jgi:tyrosinase